LEKILSGDDSEGLKIRNQQNSLMLGKNYNRDRGASSVRLWSFNTWVKAVKLIPLLPQERERFSNFPFEQSILN
jgi:hypothetical protein